MKKSTLVLSLFNFLFTFSFAQIPTDSLVAYYPLNVDASDSSGNGYNGTLSGQTPEPGMCSGAYKFLDNFIDCGDPLNDAFDLVNDATISLWVKVNSFPANYSSLVGKDVGPGQNLEKWFFAIKQGAIAFHINGPGLTAGHWIDSNPFTFSLNTYYHVVVTKSGLDYEFYINKTSYGTQTMPVNVPDVPANLQIGRNELSSVDLAIDEVAIYNSVLAPSEITQLYNNCTTGLHDPQNVPAISVYPNPVNSKLFIKTDKFISFGQVQLYNAEGRKIFTRDLHRTTGISINTGDFADGFYLLKIMTGETVYTRSVILQTP